MEILKKALLAEPLSKEEARSLMGQFMRGELTPAQMAGVLMSLRTRGEHAEELAGFAEGMREAAVRIEVSRRPLFDIVGTGGDGRNTFNLSTTTAFVLAAGGVAVAKHGNRAASSRSGAADLLQALGVRIDLPPERVAEAIETLGIGFLFAPRHHPAMRHVAPVRAELGVRTIFNLLGPLTNPAGATHYLLGVFAPEWARPMAEALRDLGAKRAWVVHGEGADELVLGRNQVVELAEGELRSSSLEVESLGLSPTPLAALAGGSPEENARLTRAILAGAESGPPRAAVLLNAAAGFYIAGKAPSVAQGLALAQEVLDSGAALELLERLVRFSQAD